MAEYDGTLRFNTRIDTKEFSNSLSSIVKGATASIAVIAAALVALGGAAVKVGIEWESAFTGVIKTVDATETEIEALSAGLRDMAKEIPVASTELAGIAEAAGQLGIATENILGFTETMANLGVATNLTSEQAATALARLANITQMPQDEFDRLGSSIVALGNNLATTEAEIVNMALRIAGAGAQVGLTEDQILAFSGALSSVGVEAEAGGTAFSTLISKMSLAVAQGGDALQDFAGVAGVTTAEFSTLFEKDAALAINTFIQGLARISDEGGSAIGTLDAIGLSDIRMRDALLRAAGASDIFTQALEISNVAWEENTALANEAALRYGTMESRIQLLKNAATDLGISFYESVSGYIGSAVDLLTGYMGRLSSAFEIGGLDGLVSEIGAVMADLVTNIVNAAPMVIEAVSGLIKSMLQSIRDNAPSLIEGAVGIVQSLIEGVISMLPEIAATGMQLLAQLATGIAQALPTLIPAAVNAVLEFALSIIDNIDLLVDAATNLVTALADGVLNAIPVLLEKAPIIIDKLVSALVENLPKLITAAYQIIIQLVQGIITNLPQLVTAAYQIIESLYSGIIEYVGNLIGAAQEIVSSVVDTIVETDWLQVGKDILMGIVNGILSVGSSVLNAIKGVLDNALAGVKSFLGIHSPSTVYADQVGAMMAEGVAEGVEDDSSVTSAFEDMAKENEEVTVKMMEAINTAIRSSAGTLGASAEAVAMRVKSGFATMITGSIEVVRQTMAGMLNAMNAGASSLYAKANEIANNITRTFASALDVHSPSRVMYDLFSDVMRGIYDGMADSENMLYRKANLISEELAQRLAIKAQLTPEIIDTFNTMAGMSVLSIPHLQEMSQPGMMGGGNVYSPTLVMDVTTPKPLSESELTQEAENAFRRMAWQVP